EEIPTHYMTRVKPFLDTRHVKLSDVAPNRRSAAQPRAPARLELGKTRAMNGQRALGDRFSICALHKGDPAQPFRVVGECRKVDFKGLKRIDKVDTALLIERIPFKNSPSGR